MGEFKKKVSVVVITYNQENYIRYTLESIVEQKVNFDMEVLVGEDCSTDGTAGIVKEFAEKYPDLFTAYIREKNLGMTANFLDLLRRTQGEYLAVIEGDDYWIDNEYLQKHVDFLDSNKDYSACFSHCIIVDQNNVRHTDREKYSCYLKRDGDYEVHDFEEYLLPGQTSTGMHRLNLYKQNLQRLEELKFDITHFRDIHFVLMMLSCGKIYVSNEEVSAYRYILDLESGSWSSKNDIYRAESLINYLQGLKELENVAKALGLNVNYDERRKYEWDKFAKNKFQFTKEDGKRIKNLLINDSNNKFSMLMYAVFGSNRKIK